MRAVVIHETGGPDVLSYEEADPPAPGEGEVLIRVSAASVNPVDWKTRRGSDTLPKVLGRDASGTVETSRAHGFAEGDEVFGRPATGAYAELATAAAGDIAKKPGGISHEQAAAIPVAGGTAWQGLFDHGGLEGGQTVLISGAAGGVGHFAVQFAKNVAGARVIGTGSSRNRDFVLGLGADDYVAYDEQPYVGEVVNEVDLAFDTVGGETTATLVPAIREGGRLVGIAGPPPKELADERGIGAEVFSANPTPEQLGRIADLVASGEVRVEIAEVLPLAEVRRAHEQSEAGHVRGKIVLTVG